MEQLVRKAAKKEAERIKRKTPDGKALRKAHKKGRRVRNKQDKQEWKDLQRNDLQQEQLARFTIRHQL
jgi:hypothetical protein